MKKILFVIISSVLMFGCNDKQTLYVYNWSDYISPEYINSFENTYNCKVIVDSFDSNETMFVKLQNGAAGYDIVVPSSYQVELLASENLIEELDKDKIPNVFKNFDKRYNNQILDKDCKYSVPYIVTYTGFLYNKDKVDIIPNSWSVLENKKFQSKITLLDDIREVIGAGLMYNGFSINSTNENEISIATQTVLKWKEHIRKFDSESYRTEVVDKATWIGHGYSSDSTQVILNEGEIRNDIAFVLPKEGFCIAWDELVILKSSKNKELAYKFINELYTTENAKLNIEYVCGIMPQAEAIKILDETLKSLFILPDEVLKHGQVLKSFVNNSNVQLLYNRAWDVIKSVK